MELALFSLGLVLEELLPGAVDRWVEITEGDGMATEVRRLHDPVPNPELACVMRETVALVRRGRAFVKIHGCAPARRVKKRG